MADIKIEKPTKEKLKDLKIENWSPWSCEPTVFDWQYSANERAYVFEGRVKVTPVGGKAVEIKGGDLVLFPKGMRCKWEVIERIKKVYRFE